MTGKEKFVRKIVANCVIVAVIVAVFSVSFAYIRRDVSAADAPIYKGGAADQGFADGQRLLGHRSIFSPCSTLCRKQCHDHVFVGGSG